MTVFEHVTEARARFQRVGIQADQARLDAELLARQILGWDRGRFLSNKYDQAPGRFAVDYEQMVSRRERREPVSYIIGVREFWGLELEVGRDVLIPRPETELIVGEALACFGDDRDRPLHLVDAGTGSGCLAIALALEFPSARITATDISAAALVVARRNAARHHATDRIRFVETSFLCGIEGPVDAIVSNPPYVPALSAPAVSPEVRDFEPQVAVFSGPAGLQGVREPLGEARALLEPGGWLIFEFGYGQDDQIVALVREYPAFAIVRIRNDLQGIPRTAVLMRV